MEGVALRPYKASDEALVMDLWLRTWHEVYLTIDFTKRLGWWKGRWRKDIIPHATITVAERDGRILGFVTLDNAGYIDQILVAPELWGLGLSQLLMEHVKKASPKLLTLQVNDNNGRAIRFYEKQGFAIVGKSVNEFSGKPTLVMEWKP